MPVSIVWLWLWFALGVFCSRTKTGTIGSSFLLDYHKVSLDFSYVKDCWAEHGSSFKKQRRSVRTCTDSTEHDATPKSCTNYRLSVKKSKLWLHILSRNWGALIFLPDRRWLHKLHKGQWWSSWVDPMHTKTRKITICKYAQRQPKKNTKWGWDKPPSSLITVQAREIPWRRCKTSLKAVTRCAEDKSPESRWEG